MHVRKKKSLIDQAIDQASDYMDAARPAIESAVDQIVELASDARDKAAPLLAEGRVMATEKAAVAAELASQTAALGAERAADLASASRDYAAAKVAEAKGEPQKSKGSKVRKLLIFGTILAVGGVVVSKLKSKSEADNWHSSYVPPSSSTGSTSPSSSTSSSRATTTATTTGSTRLAPGVGSGAVGADDPMAKLFDDGGPTDDPGGASPDEALADAAEEPHPVTTPDDPADVVELDPTESPSKKS
jgi:vacuolar-type H+-ATPase subunit E/Vma4